MENSGQGGRIVAGAESNIVTTKQMGMEPHSIIIDGHL